MMKQINKAAGMKQAIIAAMAVSLVFGGVVYGEEDHSDSLITATYAQEEVEVGEIPDIIAQALDYPDQETIIQKAIERNAARTGLQTAWKGPVDGPKAVQDKKVGILVADGGNAIQVAWGNAIAEACEVIGWESVTFDGKGSTQTQSECINQAVAMGCNGIVMNPDAAALQSAITTAEAAGIPTVGMHSNGMWGPNEEMHLLNNICPDAYELALAHVDYAIADSNGKGRVIVLYDDTYSIGRMEARGMEAMVNGVESMELLASVGTPLAEMTINMPQLTASWISEFGLDPENPIYVLTVADVYFDYSVPTLRTSGVDTACFKLVASDGTESGYQRVRTGDYQVCTMPTSAKLYGYEAVDSLNRYFAGEEQSPFAVDTYVVTIENIDLMGGDQNEFIPENGFIETYKAIWGVE